jgi:hypothetical protein
VGFSFWAKGKVEGMAAGVQEMADADKKVQDLLNTANANAFTPPAGGVLSEPRLVAFLGVRKQVYAVYEAHKADIDALARPTPEGQDPSFSDLATGISKSVGVINQLRLARAQGLVAANMSEAEYAHLVSAVYTSMIASEVGKSTGDKSVSETTAESYRQAAKAMEEQANATPDPNLPPEAQQAFRDAQEQMRQAQREMEQQADEAAQRTDADVPPENIALFRKYEDDIKKYAMSGLEWAGL